MTKHLTLQLFVCAEHVITTKLEDMSRLGCPICTLRILYGPRYIMYLGRATDKEL
jgi:DNA-directed RNA polymerase subunit RPC12/RpoP